MRLSNGLLISTALHASVLLIADTPIDNRARDIENQGLEVVLVNAKSEEIPTEAQAVAQVNLAGGGEASQGIATSPDLPADRKQTGQNANTKGRAANAIDPTPDAVLARLQVQEQQLLTSLKQSLMATPLRQSASSSGTNGEVGLDDARATRLQMLDHIAKLESTIFESNQRPKRRFISPATKAAVYARYFDDMRERIEAKGTQSFPTQNGQRLYGDLIVAITVNREGRVLSTNVLSPSPIQALNQHSVDLVSAMQFLPFDKALKAVADELTVVTQFNFLQDQTVSATLQAPR
jgi:protein TonB